jgi:hypothetical protein
LVRSFHGRGIHLANGFVWQPVPALIGASVGAPVPARERETGTFRYAWTQGFGRWRWTLAKLVLLEVLVAAAGEAVSALFSWYYRPYLATGNQNVFFSQASPLDPGLFDLRWVEFAAWTLAAFACCSPCSSSAPPSGWSSDARPDVAPNAPRELR